MKRLSTDCDKNYFNITVEFHNRVEKKHRMDPKMIHTSVGLNGEPHLPVAKCILSTQSAASYKFP